MSKTIMIAAAVGGAAYLLTRKANAMLPVQGQYIPPAAKNTLPREYAYANEQFNEAVAMETYEAAGIPVVPLSPTAKQKAAAIGGALGSLGGAAGCAAFGAAAAAPLCGMVGGFVGSKAAPLVYGAAKPVAKVATGAVRVTGKLAVGAVKAPVNLVKSAVKAPVKTAVKVAVAPIKTAAKVASKLKFW